MNTAPTDPETSARQRVVALMQAGQSRLITAFEALDGGAQFGDANWERPGGGGGSARVLTGGHVFEKAGINTSVVFGSRTPPSLWQAHPKTKEQPFFATGLSMVFHPCNPFVPAFHANLRYFESGGDSWFGGGLDLTPNYVEQVDAKHFHRALSQYCGAHQADYAALKAACDRYFYVKHRHEMRGIGGIFFDEIDLGSFERNFAFIESGIDAIWSAYEPIVRRRMHAPFSVSQRQWQLYRRGRYAEFNLVYDRGTLFGLQTEGNIEAILMSLPPLVGWGFNVVPAAGSPEAHALTFFQPGRDWLDS